MCIGIMIGGCTKKVSHQEEDRPLHYLGIGNSFTWNSTHYLRDIVESEGRDIDYFVAGIGGASMGRHLESVDLFEKDPTDPKGKPYVWSGIKYDQPEVNASLREVLEATDWDVVSIQQVSWESWDPSTYEPHAERLVNYIRQYAPEAKIVVHMTWAYREDHDWFVSGVRTQQEMFDGLSAAYMKLAETYDLQIVPIGAAFQEARKLPDWTFTFPDPNFNYDSPEPETVPDQYGSLNTGWRWIDDEESGKRILANDPNHANAAGCYLGGLVHYAFLFGEPVSDSVFFPEDLNAEQATSLRLAAERAIRAYSDFNNRQETAAAL